MQSPLFKLVALAGVIGAGVMVVVQAQKSLSERQPGAAAEEFVALQEKDQPWEPSLNAAASAAPPAQSEPTPGETALAAEPKVASADWTAQSSADPFPFLYQDGQSEPSTTGEPATPSEPAPLPFMAEANAMPIPPPENNEPEPVAMGAFGSEPLPADTFLTLQPPPAVDVAGTSADFFPPGQGEPAAVADLSAPEPALAPVDITTTPEPDPGVQLAGFETEPLLAQSGEPASLRRYPQELNAPALLPPPGNNAVASEPMWPERPPEIAQALLERRQEFGTVPQQIEPAAAEFAPRDRTRLGPTETAPVPPATTAASEPWTPDFAPANAGDSGTPTFGPAPANTISIPLSDRSRDAASSGDPFAQFGAVPAAEPSSPPPDRTRLAPETRSAPNSFDTSPFPPFAPGEPTRNSQPTASRVAESLPAFPSLDGPSGNSSLPPAHQPQEDLTPIRSWNDPSQPGSSSDPFFGAPPITPELPARDGPRSSIPSNSIPVAPNSSLPPFPDFPNGNGSIGATPSLPPFPGESPVITPVPGRGSSSIPPNGIDFAGSGVVDAAVPVSQQPELRIEKDAPPKATLNQPIVYNIRVRNVGRAVAHQVVVEDSIPLGATLKGTIPEAELDPQDKHLVWKLGSIEPNQEQVIKVQIVPTQPGEIGSIATVRFVGRVASKTVITAPKLDLEMFGPVETIVGETATYKFKVTNRGDGDATNVLVRNIIPEGLRHPAGNDLEYEIGTLKAGQSREVALAVLAARPGQVTNSAVVTSNGQEQDKTAADVVVLDSRLAIARTGPQRRFVGRPANYSTQITNQSTQPLRNVTVVEQLAPGVEVAAVPEHGHIDPAKRTITWVIPQLAPQEVATVKSSLVSAARGTYASTVSARDAAGNRTEATSQLEVEGFEALQVDMSAQHGGQVAIGEQVSLRMLIHNRGSATATNVIAEFDVPEGLEFVSAKPEQYTLEGNRIRFAPLPALEINQEKTFDIVCVAKGEGQPRIVANIFSDGNRNPIREEQSVAVFREEP